MNDAHLCHAYDVLSVDITDGSLCCVVEMKYYVVFKGRRPGVYDDWPSCQMQVSGFSHSSYKSYNSKEEALMAFYGNHDIAGTEIGLEKVNAIQQQGATGMQCVTNTCMILILVLLSLIVLKLYCSNSS